MRSRYARAAAMLLTGGTKFGITIARANCRAVNGSTLARISLSRRCTCQSSGRRSAIVSMPATILSPRKTHFVPQPCKRTVTPDLNSTLVERVLFLAPARLFQNLHRSPWEERSGTKIRLAAEELRIMTESDIMGLIERGSAA